jgi:hypothetical protein
MRLLAVFLGLLAATLLAFRLEHLSSGVEAGTAISMDVAELA